MAYRTPPAGCRLGRRGRRASRFVGVALLVTVALTAGCAVRTPAAAGRSIRIAPKPIPEDAWPERYVEPLVEIATRLPGECRPPGDSSLQRHYEILVRNPSGRGTHFYEGVWGQGIINRVDVPEEPGAVRLDFYSCCTPREDFDRIVDANASHPFRQPLIDVTPFILRHPATQAPSDDAPRGVVLHLTGLFGGNKYEDVVVTRMRQRGWTTLSAGQPLGAVFRRKGVPVLPGPLLEHSAAALATELDGRLAEWAYGAEAALAWLWHAHPELEGRPVVLVGFSIGAIAAPTVAARLGKHIDAAVLIAGGADAARIATRIVLNDGDARTGLFLVAHDSSVADESLERLFELTRESARLAPYSTSAFLRDKPVLMLQASLDKVVPAETGDLLYERLEGPERWSYPVGHYGLIWLLPSKAAAIASWVDRHVGAP
ncbi:MAG: hypothetical protein ACYTF9_04225 [Planctomycetota bacterium]|jgi:fermentation-respiration switch protein FrsA (DUF1100 family)